MNFRKLYEEKYEIIGFLLLSIILIGLPFLVLSYAPWKSSSEDFKTVFLTAVGQDGVWTEEVVTNSNYWNKKFKKANLKFDLNEKILLRLTSIDVTHTFYVPELNIGPIEVIPGKVYEIPVEFSKTGKFMYYCTTICGNCHFYMQGNIYVNLENAADELFTLEGNDITLCGNFENVAFTGSFIENGKALFNSNGCVTCHGENGKGGVYNPNYVSDYIPEISDIAEKMYIYWEEDADIIIQLLEEGADLEKLLDDPPFRRYNRFLAQYKSIMSKITDGASDLQKKDKNGPIPPLYMPSWKDQLAKEDINSILAYLIDQNDWDN